jgi:hypothetical protein
MDNRKLLEGEKNRAMFENTACQSKRTFGNEHLEILMIISLCDDIHCADLSRQFL